jgi:hypothetical protein
MLSTAATGDPDMLVHSLARSRTLEPLAVRVALVLALLTFAAADSVRAEPPCWAPAHGHRAKHGSGDCGKHHRKKHKGGYHGSGGHEGGHRSSGTGDGISVGGLVGAAIGGYAGSKVGKGSGNVAATAAGAVGGYIVGQEVERQLSEPNC